MPRLLRPTPSSCRVLPKARPVDQCCRLFLALRASARRLEALQTSSFLRRVPYQSWGALLRVKNHAGVSAPYRGGAVRQTAFPLLASATAIASLHEPLG